LTEPIYSELDYRDAPLPLIELNPLGIDARIDKKYQIDRALAQILDPIGVKFQSSIQKIPPSRDLDLDSDRTVLQVPNALFQTLEYRLWVVCSSQKSLDYQLIAEPLAKTLRSLNLEGFVDATIRFTPSGARSTDWRLRIDLAPPAVMLRDWARWGDVQAMTELLNFALAPSGMQVSTVLKNLTLHIFCTLTQSASNKFPTKKIALDIIAPLAIELSPQGIQGATIYGLKVATTIGSQVNESPVWTHWLDLPALGDPIYSPTPLMLAERGDFDALSFVLHRFLNPDLERYLELGGIKLSILTRRQLIHVMSEAPICPLQSQIAAPVVKILTQLNLPGIKGIRVHGRGSGQSTPVWTYGIDFDRQPLELPPAAPAEVFTPPAKTKIGIAQRLSQYLVATQIWTPQLTAVKTSQLVYQQRFRWQPSLFLLLVGGGLAIGGDWAMTTFLTDPQLVATSASAPSQLSFNNPLLEQKLAQYQVRCVQQGVPDVLIIGSSRALRGIDPAVLRRSLGKGDLKVYNFGINGATAQVVDLVLRQLLTPQQLPKLVIWADGARAFNSGRADRTYETIALSDRYRQLALMAGNANSPPLLQAQSSFKNSYQAIDSAVDARLAQVSPVYHHRDRLKSWLQAQVPFVSQIVDSSNSIVNPDLLPSHQEPQIDSDGFLPLAVKFDPTTYYQEHPRVTGDSDGDYANFQLTGIQHQSLRQTIDLLSSHNIPLVFVNAPVSDLYLDKFRRDREVLFKQYMQQFMDLHQLAFVDMDGFLNTQYDRFSDPSHLNRFGASEVSRYLAQTTLIPWQSVK
jgi:hypothetical protein